MNPLQKRVAELQDSNSELSQELRKNAKEVAQNVNSAISALEIGFEVAKLASPNDEVFYSLQKIPLIPAPLNRLRETFFASIEKERLPSRKEAAQALNPALVRDLEEFASRVENGERVLRLPSDEEWRKLTDPTKFQENFLPNIDVKVKEKDSKE